MVHGLTHGRRGGGGGALSALAGLDGDGVALLVGGSGLGAVALEGLALAFLGGGPHQSTNAADGPRLPESRPQKREISERCCPNRAAANFQNQRWAVP